MNRVGNTIREKIEIRNWKQKTWIDRKLSQLPDDRI